MPLQQIYTKSKGRGVITKGGVMSSEYSTFCVDMKGFATHFRATGGEDCSSPCQLGGTPQRGPSAGVKGSRSQHPG